MKLLGDCFCLHIYSVGIQLFQFTQLIQTKTAKLLRDASQNSS